MFKAGALPVPRESNFELKSACVSCFGAGKCSSPSGFGVGVSPTFKAGAPVLPCASNVGAKKSVLLSF